MDRHLMQRRDVLAAAIAGALAASAGSARPETRAALAFDAAAFHAARRYARTVSGMVSYVERGSGPVALFLHGVPLNGFHWRHVMAALQDMRRCIALDLMGLGYTRLARTQDVSFTAQAQMVREFLDALGIEQVDLVANDSGGAVAQIFASHHPQRLRTLTLTNCDVHTNWPPPSILPAIEFARQGVLADRYEALLDKPAERHARFAHAWADPTVVTDEVYRVYIEPLIESQRSRDNFHRYWTSFDNLQTRAIESRLRQLQVPTLVVWALDDPYFDVRWAHWLRDAIPGVRRVVEVPGAKLFFPEDQPRALVEPLRWWLALSPAGT